MHNAEALAAMGQQSLLLPGRLRAALSANDRLKLRLSILQSAVAHAERPDSGIFNLDADLPIAGREELRKLPPTADAASLARTIDLRNLH